jgi:hypothetical protein
LQSPLIRIQVSSSFDSALFIEIGVILKLCESFSKALLVLVSVVFCEIIVIIRVSNGVGLFFTGSDGVSLASRIFKSVAANI